VTSRPSSGENRKWARYPRVSSTAISGGSRRSSRGISLLIAFAQFSGDGSEMFHVSEMCLDIFHDLYKRYCALKCSLSSGVRAKVRQSMVGRCGRIPLHSHQGLLVRRRIKLNDAGKEATGMVRKIASGLSALQLRMSGDATVRGFFGTDQERPHKTKSGCTVPPALLTRSGQKKETLFLLFFRNFFFATFALALFLCCHAAPPFGFEYNVETLDTCAAPSGGRLVDKHFQRIFFSPLFF